MTSLPAFDHPSPQAQLRAAVAMLVAGLLDQASTPAEIQRLAAAVHVLHQEVDEPDPLLAVHVRQLLRNADRDMVERGFYALRLTQASDRL